MCEDAHLGLRGTRAGHVAELLRQGLTRPSAGWFLRARELDWSPATWATAAWMGIGRNVRTAGELTERAPTYASFFQMHPENVPTLVLFTAPPHQENLRTYYWRGVLSRGVTDRYAKLERSGALAPLRVTALTVLRLTPEETQDIEQRAASRQRSDADDESLAVKISLDAQADRWPLVGTKMANFCALAGEVLRARC